MDEHDAASQFFQRAQEMKLVNAFGGSHEAALEEV
jgi:hypothetical protein